MSNSLLSQAREVTLPSRQEMLHRAPSVSRFWNENRDVFEGAWTDWEQSGGHGDIALDASLYDPQLRQAIALAWDDPTSENAVKDLWEEVFPGVYKAQFFDPEKLSVLRDYLDRAKEAGIPMRPPYGIVLNRGGAMLDPRSEGYLAAPTFQAFYRDLMDHYMRPVARLLFPDVYGYDSQTFGFSVEWQAGGDTDLRAHTDASSVTFNVNLNLPGEEFSGSAVRFMDPAGRQVEDLTFEPGTALIHHGSVPHASLPIVEGQRQNLIMWLYGEKGQTPYPHGVGGPVPSAQERWTVPSAKPDGFAPF